MPATTPTLGSGGIALVVLTLICWVMQLIYLSFVVGREFHGDAVVGQAFAWIAAMIFAGFTWLWLGGLVLQAGTRDMLPGGAALIATGLYLVSALATAAALFLLQDPGRTWPVIVPALLPPIVVFFVIAMYQPSLRPMFSGTRGSAAVACAVLILSLAPLPFAVQTIVQSSARGEQRRKDAEEWKANEAARNREENLLKLQAMTRDDPVMNWYGLLEENSGVRQEALEALRKVERRQADIEDMLPYGIPRAMMLLPELDLKATPQLCEAARAFLLKSAEGSRIRPKQDPVVYAAEGDLEKSLPAIRWLMAHGCNCDEGVAAMKASVESHLDSPDRQRALAAIAELRGPR